MKGGMLLPGQRRSLAGGTRDGGALWLVGVRPATELGRWLTTIGSCSLSGSAHDGRIGLRQCEYGRTQ